MSLTYLYNRCVKGHTNLNMTGMSLRWESDEFELHVKATVNNIHIRVMALQTTDCFSKHIEQWLSPTLSLAQGPVICL